MGATDSQEHLLITKRKNEKDREFLRQALIEDELYTI